ncbi:MAG: hypothetical protein IPN02_18845 [Candidatus Microthrix sp.]|uniref:Uncharacterized protein n=1 Tax=Candidatus Neomicrothrix subdominans TaxID=2954438 RepID=A0A936TGH5_9ACTN|nr:hypothetical protein [Candidatus Microthrix subdominans]
MAAQFNSVVLPEPLGCAGDDYREPGGHDRWRNRAAATPSMPCLTSWSSEENATPVNFRMFTIRRPPRGQIVRHDVKSRPVGELRALEAEQRLERAMRPGGIVEQSGQRADDVVVVVEHPW